MNSNISIVFLTISVNLTQQKKKLFIPLCISRPQRHCENETIDVDADRVNTLYLPYAHLLTFSVICERISVVSQISSDSRDESCAMHSKTVGDVASLVTGRIKRSVRKNGCDDMSTL